MRRYKVLLSMVLCIVFVMTSTMVFADTAAKNILTLDDAKKIALQNDVQLKLQDSYIQQKSEDYADMSDSFNANRGVKASTAAGKAEGRIGNQVSLENANYAVKQEVFDKNNLKRASNYNVTKAYYDVMKAKYSLADAARDLDLAKKDLDIAKIKVELGLITSSALTQVENAYKTSQATYNTEYSDLQNAMATLGKTIGKTLDLSTDDVDMTIGMPDISTIDLNKIKEDYIQNNSDFFTAKKALDLAKYKQFLVSSEYDDMYDTKIKTNDDTRDDFEDMLYKANRDLTDSQYSYDEAVKSLDLTLKTSYSGLVTLKDAIDNLRKSVDTARITYTQNKTKYDIGMIAKNELDKSEDSLKDLESKLNTTIIDFNLSYLGLTQYSYTQTK